MELQGNARRLLSHQPISKDPSEVPYNLLIHDKGPYHIENESIDLSICKPVHWFLYGRDLRHERAKLRSFVDSNSSFDIEQYFMENWKRFLDLFEILSNAYVIKLDDSLSIPNSTINNSHFTVEFSDSNFPLLNILIIKQVIRFGGIFI